MKNGLLIYGCYGYTGKLISEHAVACGLKPVLAGRDSERVKQLANRLNLDFRVFDLNNQQAVAEQLVPFQVVIHCAGPFKFTSKVMANACIQSKTHYLDITGEYQVFEDIFGMDELAQKAEVLLMPGVGFDVVPTDCMAAFLKDLLPDAVSLEMGLLQRGGRLSHGTALTIAEGMGEKCVVRKNGKLTEIDNGSLVRKINMDNKLRSAVAIPWGDISTAYRTTGIPNIVVYNFLPQKVIDSMKFSNYISFILKNKWVKKLAADRIKKRPAGPSDDERQRASGSIWGEVKNGGGETKTAVIDLPEGYTLTALTAVKIAQNVLSTSPPFGAKTPAQVYGRDFILQFNGVSRREI
ncbi:MAG: saccharopine dehydrogenase NADP-binding domain-containing protein [Chitinophagales bacterium]